MRYLLALAILASFGVPVCYAGDKADGGFAAHAGMGSTYGAGGGDGIGATIEYQALLRPKLRITPFLGAGVVGGEQPDIPVHRFAYSAGAYLEYGRHHRLFAGPSFNTQWVSYDHDEAADRYNNIHTLIGPSLVAGYKGTARFGLLWQIHLGLAFIVNYPEDFQGRKNNPVPAFGFGAGYKI